MKDELELFNCLVCHKKANKPIVTQCGHLHWYHLSLPKLEMLLQFNLNPKSMLDLRKYN